MVNVLDVANLVVTHCICKNNPVSIITLQKILYLIQKQWMYTHQGNALFEDDFVAGLTGPIIPSVYEAYSNCLGSSLNSLDELDFVQKCFGIYLGNKDKLNANYSFFIINLVDNYQRVNPWELAALLNKPGNAWFTVYDSGNGYGKIIDKDKIMNEYCK